MLKSDLTPPQQMVRLLMGFISARAIYTGAKLDLADQIDDAGSTVEQLSARLGVDRSALERLLRSLTGLGVLHGNDSGQFFLTPVGETLRRSSPGSIRDYAIYVHEFLYDLVGVFPAAYAPESLSSKRCLGRRYSLTFSSIRTRRRFSMQAWPTVAALRRLQYWTPTASVIADGSRT